MARPLPSPKLARGGLNGTPNGRPTAAAAALLHPAPPPEAEEAGPTSEELQELERLREENEQLRALCLELEQALNEATQHAAEGDDEESVKEYEALLDEKTELIRQLHEQLQEAQAVAAELDAQSGAGSPGAAAAGPAPREDELLTLSEDLERERRQLQEDEQALMQQMREMEVTMARERAEMARQRNDMQRLQSDVRHEIERLERSGSLQNKIDGLKSKLNDAMTRRGSSPGAAAQPAQPVAATPPSGKKEGLLGRLFGGK